MRGAEATGCGEAADSVGVRRARCRMLGHDVEFAYCRAQPDGHVCRHILNCWWERFDVESLLREICPDELDRLHAAAPVSRLAAIVDLANRAKATVSQSDTGASEVDAS